MNQYMKLAIEEAYQGIENGHGGPFGCVIVHQGKVVGRGHNMVVLEQDPTCHGEMQAIRDACKNLSSFDLSECELYTTGEPCNMCLSACIWANIKTVYYGCSISDNEYIGFRDKKIDDIFGREKVSSVISLIQVDREECMKLFDHYKSLPDKTVY